MPYRGTFKKLWEQVVESPESWTIKKATTGREYLQNTGGTIKVLIKHDKPVAMVEPRIFKFNQSEKIRALKIFNAWAGRG